MSEQIAVACDALTKEYHLGEQVSLTRSFNAMLPWVKNEIEAFHALHDVSFEIERGAYFGIVGSNGSGKSTLTQILAGIAVPTSGTARVWGRILPLLEVGAGFHHELTGRENVYLLGTILGLSRGEIRAELGRIADFAGVGNHMDTPLKRYSSGMQARLSFATAICFPADVYVFDEVLAVVDDDFRERCAERLSELNAAGRTIVFMSHDLDLVRSVCRTGMWLEQGRVRVVGDIGDVARQYAVSRGEAAAALAN